MLATKSVCKDDLSILIDEQGTEHFLFDKDAEICDEIHLCDVFIVFAVKDSFECGKSTISFFAFAYVFEVILKVFLLFVF